MDFQYILQLLQPDTLSLICCGVLVLMAVAATLLSPFFRAVKPFAKEAETNDTEEVAEGVGESNAVSAPKLSVILTPHDNVEQLERNLDAYLSQEYPDYEVIVVTQKGDRETTDALKRYVSNARLYTTYTPDSSRYMPREKLAITLGVKAAKSEWIVLADIACRPDSSLWLSTLAQNMTQDKNLVLTHTRYDAETKACRRFARLYHELYLLKEDLKGRAYKADGGCLAFRKSDFMAAEGFRGNLKYLRGEYDFLVNRHARPDSVAVELDRLAWLTEDEPTDKHYIGQRLFYMETRQHLDRSAAHRRPYNTHQFTLHTNFLLHAAAITVAAITARWLLLGVAVVTLLTSLITRAVMGRRVLRTWDEPMSAPAVAIHEFRLAWSALAMFRRYQKSNKNDFISHKL